MAQAIPPAAHGRSARVGWPAAALIATLVLGVPVEQAAYPGNPVAAAGDLAVAAAFVAAGAVVWAQVREADLTGPLMAATGVAWLAGSLADELALLHRGPLVQLLLTAPYGRPRTWAEWLVVAAAYADGVVPAVGRDEDATVVLAVLIAGLALERWARAGGLTRRARAVPAAASIAIGLVLVAGAFADTSDADAVLRFYEAVLVATAAALFVDLQRGGWAQSAVTTLVVDLGDTRMGSLAAALAHAVGDPSLEVGYRLGDGRYVDDHGRTLALPSADAGRAVTDVEVGGSPAAVLVHDPAALRARGLSDAVTAAVRLARDNVRLQADIRARVRDVEASRARLLRARDTERRRLETRLRARVGRRLDAAARALAELSDDPDELTSALPGEFERTQVELHRFAAGLHPRDLEAGGLAVALPELVAGTPLPVGVKVECGRLDAALEAAAWFVCSEGLANVVKHAAAARADIRAERAPGWLVVTVRDDGRGGADSSGGRGLRGLAARVEATGGRLEVGDGPNGGTCLVARLPLRERA